MNPRKLFTIVALAATSGGVAASISLAQSINMNSVTGQKLVPRHGLAIEEYWMSHDTLSIEVSDDFVWYPFGEYVSTGSLKADFYRNHKPTDGGAYRIVDSVGKSGDSLLFLINTKDSILFVADLDNYRAITLVAAKITSKSIQMKNGIRVGMSKREALSRFFAAMPSRLLKKINVVKVSDVLYGVWHYYLFEKERLVTVLVITGTDMSHL